MAPLTQILAVLIKELRELLHRPALVLTLILGPLAVLIVFGLGSDATPQPPRVIIVVPSAQAQPRLLQTYRRQIEESLVVTAYTADEAAARRQLARKAVDAVLILPPAPFETIASGKPATLTVLYNEIDPLWRGLVPRFVRGLASDLNRAIFLEQAGAQQTTLADAAHDLDGMVGVLDQAILAVNREDWRGARAQLRDAITVSTRLVALLDALGAQATPLRAQVERAQQRLVAADALLDTVERATTPATTTTAAQLGLLQTRQNVQGLRDAIAAYTTVPPDVVIAPLAVETQLVARIEPDFITFFAPAILALLLQHVAVSLGALALVRERLAGTFDLYVIAPIGGLRLLIGKYVAYVGFTLALAGVLLGVLLWGLDVPLLGSPWRLALILSMLALASVGLGLALSLLAASERQAVQLSMLALLAMVFFSGFALPLKALRQPALSISYALPATYGVVLLQDVMLRGLPGSDRFLLVLGGIALGLFLLCWRLLRWRTAAQ